MTRTGIYLRVSTEEQAADGWGLEVQRDKCRAMAQLKGWEIVREYTDEGLSGTLEPQDRPTLRQLMEDARADELDAVIVAAYDRLGRKTRIVLDIIERLAEWGVQFVSCKEQVDTSTPIGQFVLTQFAAIAQLERDMIVERTTDGRNRRGQEDGEKGGRVPMGYRRLFHEGGKATGELQIHEEEARVIRSMFAWRSAGNSLRTIADKLNTAGIRTSRGNCWHASSVKVVLDNEDKYRGRLRGESNQAWPTILA